MLSFDSAEEGFELRAKGADAVTAFLRIRLPRQVREIRAADGGGEAALASAWDERSRSLLISYPSRAKEVTVVGKF